MDHDRQAVMEQSDEALESQIVSARAALRHDLMLLEEKVSPRAIVDRRRRRIRERIGRARRDLRQRADEVLSEVRSETHTLQREVEQSMEHTMSESKSRLSSTRAKVAEVPRRAISGVRQSGYSRPLLFAGLAFAAGWGISRAMPMTRPEERIAERVVPVVEERVGPMVDEARTAVTESAREAFSQRDL